MLTRVPIRMVITVAALIVQLIRVEWAFGKGVIIFVTWYVLRFFFYVGACCSCQCAEHESYCEYENSPQYCQYCFAGCDK